MKELKVRQICLFFLTFLPITKFFVLPSIISKTANEDMWISELISLFLDFIVVLTVLNVAKKNDCTFYELLEYSFGKFGAKIITFLYVIYFFSKGLVPILEQKDFIELTLYITMPNNVYFLPFFFIAFYFAIKKLRCVGRISDILWIISLIGVLLLLSLSVKNADYGAILPIGANKFTEILKGTYLSFSWHGDGVYMLFFLGEFKYEKKTTLKVLGAFLLSTVITLFFMITFYCTFTSIAFRQHFALTEISKYTTVINNTGRLDYIGLILILLPNTFALALPVFFSGKLLNKVFEFKKEFIAPLIVTVLYAVITLLFYQYVYSIRTFFMRYMGIYFFVFGVFLPLLLPLLSLRRKTYAKTQN